MVKKKLYRKAHRFFKNNPKNLPSTKLAKPKRKWKKSINPQVYQLLAYQAGAGAVTGSVVAGKGRRKKGALYGSLGGGVLGGALGGYLARPKKKVKRRKR